VAWLSDSRGGAPRVGALDRPWVGPVGRRDRRLGGDSDPPGVIAISVARPRNGGIPAHYYSTIWVAGAAAVVVTVLEGVLIGFRRLWWGVPAAAALGTVCLAGCYVIAFMVAQPNDPSSDNAAGAGLVIFGVPAFVVLLALIAVGFGIARGAKLIYRAPRFLS